MRLLNGSEIGPAKGLDFCMGYRASQVNALSILKLFYFIFKIDFFSILIHYSALQNAQ